MKVCTKCKQEKSLEEFDFRNKAKGTRRSDCKTCVSSWMKKDYERPERALAVRANAKKRKEELVNLVWEYKSTHPCVDCGRTHPAGLEFDHLPEFEKSMDISLMVTNMHSWENILAEIAKCEVVCGYCHGIRTFERAGWVRQLREIV